MGRVNMDYFTFKIGIYKYVMCLSLYFTPLSEYRYQRILLLRVPQDLLFLGYYSLQYSFFPDFCWVHSIHATAFPTRVGSVNHQWLEFCAYM